jgi:hypothetical protein
MGTGGSAREEPAKAGPAGALMARMGTTGLLALSVVLAIALAASLAGWSHERAELQGRIAALTQQGARTQAVWKAQLAACHAASGPPQAVRATGAVQGDDAARRLLAQGPEGIDVCARMESADQAVLSTLK